MEAVELVLKSFYAMGEPPIDTLPSAIGSKVHLLLKALMVAERYQADICKEKIAEALSSIPASDLSYEAIKLSFKLPDALYDMPLLSRFKEATIEYLYQRYGDLSWVVSSDSLLSEFLEELAFSTVLPLMISRCTLRTMWPIS